MTTDTASAILARLCPISALALTRLICPLAALSPSFFGSCLSRPCSVFQISPCGDFARVHSSIERRPAPAGNGPPSRRDRFQKPSRMLEAPARYRPMQDNICRAESEPLPFSDHLQSRAEGEAALGRFLGPKQNFRQVVVCLRVIRIFLQGSPELLLGLGLACPVVNLTQAEMHSRKVRSSFQDFLVFTERVRVLLISRISLRLQSVNEHGIRIHILYFLERFERQRSVKPCQLIPDLDIAWVCPHQLVEVLQSIQLSIERLKRHGSVISRAPVFRVGSQLVVKTREGFLEVIDPKVRHSEVEAHFRVQWIRVEDLLENFNGLRKLELSLVYDTQSLEDFRLAGKRGEALPIDLFRSRVILDFLELVGSGEKAFERL